MKYSSENFNEVINKSFKHFDGFFDYEFLTEEFLEKLDAESKEKLLEDVKNNWGNSNMDTLEKLIKIYDWRCPLIFLVNLKTEVCYIITSLYDCLDYPDSITIPIENFVDSINEALTVIRDLNDKSTKVKPKVESEEKQFL